MAQIGDTNFSMKPSVDMASIASLFQKKASDEQTMKLQQSQMESQQQDRVMNVMKMASELTQNLISTSQQNLMKQSIGHISDAMGMMTSQPTAETQPARSSLFPGMTTAAAGTKEVPFTSTPEGQNYIKQNTIKAYPQEAAKKLAEYQAKQLFETPKTGTSLQPKQFTNLEGKSVMVAPDASGKFDVPEGYIDPTIARAKVFAQPRVVANEIKESQFQEGQWNKLEKAVNGLDKGARSSVGMAAVGNQRAARALAVLDDPNMDPVRLKFVMADLAGIMQGGAPHEVMLRQAGYDNVVSSFANLKQKITAEPQAIAIPEIRQQLKDTITGIMQVDNQILDANVGIAKEGFLKAIESDPKRFARMTKALDVVKTVGAKPASDSAAKAALRKKLGL